MVNIESSLREIKVSLDEDRNSSFIPLLRKHHDYLKQFIPHLMDKNSKNKKEVLSFFIKFFSIHARAEEETLYMTLEKTEMKDTRLEGLIGQDEHELALEIIEELRELDYENNWNEEIEERVRVLAGLVKGHFRHEENEMFPMIQRDLGDIVLGNLTNRYITKCHVYLNIELNIIPDQMVNDMRTLFY
jgi:hemerythrin superfamily protein